MGWLSYPTAETGDHGRTNLQNTGNKAAASDSIPDTIATAGLIPIWMGRSMLGEMVKPGIGIGVDDAGT